MPESAIIYARASKDPKGRATSVESQIESCQAWAQQQGIEVVAVIADNDRSASRAAKRQREGYLDLLDRIEGREADLLLIWENSRASRDVAEMMTLVNLLEDAQMLVALVSSGRRYDPSVVEDRQALGLGAIQGEGEARHIRARVRRGVAANAAKGRPHGRVPYGYSRVYDPATGHLLEQVIREDQAEVLRRAVARVLEGDTLRRICLDLNAEGVPTARRPRKTTAAENVVTTWTPDTLRQLLRQPAIAGLRQHQKQILGPAAWPAIVLEEDWHRVQQLFRDPKRNSNPEPRGAEPRYLLSNIAICAVCRTRLRSTRTSSRMEMAYVCRTEGCFAVTISGARADEVVERVVELFFIRDDVKAAINAQHQARERRHRRKAAPSQSLAELRARLDAAVADFTAGGMSAAMLARVESQIQPLIDAAQEIEEPPPMAPEVRRLLDAADLWAGWQAADLASKRRLLRELFVIEVHRSTKRGRRFHPERVKITMKPE